MMFKKALSAMLSAAVLALTGTVMPADALDTQPKEMTEGEALANVCAELGIEDFDAYLAKLEARLRSDADRKNSGDTCPYDPEYFIDIYTGGDSNGRIDAKDANYLMQFLKGQVNYPYDYADLDPTHDYIIDRADVDALLECYSAVSIIEVYPDFVPGTHSTNGAPSSSLQTRYYVKHFADNSQSDITYSLNSSTLPVSMTNQRLLQAPAASNRGFQRVQSTRTVRCAGTGSIIGSHLILTAAHCVYKRNTQEYDTSSLVTAFQFSDDGEPIKTHLTIKSFHVPRDYIDFGGMSNDYALIEVEENLDTLGYDSFEMGLPLTGITGTEIGVEGFPQFDPCTDTDY